MLNTVCNRNVLWATNRTILFLHKNPSFKGHIVGNQ
jgi:hypothetical protein